MVQINSALAEIDVNSSTQLEPGVVYTRPWAVDLILDLAGYTSDKPLADLLALEPSAGDGAFLVGMVRRLVESCKRRRVKIESAINAIKAYEIDARSAIAATSILHSELVRLGIGARTAARLSQHWIKHEDFLQIAPTLEFADFVIGNPPYIRLEEIPAGKADFYRRSYDTMRGRADIYIAFYQAALTRLKPGGVCAYICADRWLRNNYGRALRTFIHSGYSVRYIVETHDVSAFAQNVSAYPSITVISRDRQGLVVVARALPGIESVTNQYVVSHIKSARSNSVLTASRFENWFAGGEPWSCSSPEALQFLKKLEERFPSLESQDTQTTVGIGVATGADDVFITNDPPNIEQDRLLPIAMVSDLQKGKATWSGNFLINPWDANGLVNLEKYPRLKQYFSQFHEVLKGRHTAKNRPEKWHRTIDRVNLPLLKQHKLYIADIRNSLSPSLDLGKTYPHHNLYWITSKSWELRMLGALLMSEVGEFFIRCYGVKMRGGYYRFQAQYLRRIRIPKPETITKSIGEKLIAAWESRDIKLATEIALRLYGIKSLPKTN